MRAAQLDENNVVTGIYMVGDLAFMPNLVADIDGTAGVGHVFDSETVTFAAPDALPAQVESLSVAKLRLADAVDSLVAAVYQRWTRFEPEYTAREKAAREYVAAGSVGNPGVWIVSFAVPAGLTSEVAASRIIEQADALREALEDLAALRMAKYGIFGAADMAGAQAAHDGIVNRVLEIAEGLA